MYIITGGAGFIGSAVIWELNKRGIQDILVVDNLALTSKWQNLVTLKISDYVHKNVFIEKVRKEGLGKNVFGKKIEGIVHLGACSATTEQDADYLMENNFHYTRDLFLKAKEENIRFVNASSAATYGNGEFGFSDNLEIISKLRPLNMYGYSKQLFDLWTIETGNLNNLVSLKFFNVYGPNEYHKDDMRSVVCKAVSQIHETGTVKLFKSYKKEYADGGQMRDFVYIKDVSCLVDWLLQNPKITGIYNVGQGKARSWIDLVSAVFNSMEKKINIEFIEMPEQLQGKYQYFTEADMSWLKKVNYPHTFMTLEEGVKDYVQNYLLQENIYLDSRENNK